MDKLSLADKLAASSLTPGTYQPSFSVKNDEHAAVLVSGTPLILTGPADDAESIRQAECLAVSPEFIRMVRVAGLTGGITVSAIRGGDINWPKQCDAIVSKPCGQVEHGNEDGPLMTIILGDSMQPLATAMCVTTTVAQVIDPFAPNLDTVH